MSIPAAERKIIRPFTGWEVSVQGDDIFISDYTDPCNPVEIKIKGSVSSEFMSAIAQAIESISIPTEELLF